MGLTLNDVFLIQFEGRHDDQQILNNFTYLVTDVSIPGPDTFTVNGALINALGGAGSLLDKYLECCSVDLVDVRVNIQQIDFLRYSKRTYFTVDFEQGRIAGPCMPSNVAGAITVRGELASRHGIGTKHMPAVPIDAIVNGKIIEDQQELYGTFATQILEKFEFVDIGGTVDLTPVIYNRSNLAESQPIASFVVQDTSRTMRRRGLRLGS